MNSYNTPRSIAIALSRHAPRRIHRLLDPAVGQGMLVEAVCSRLAAGAERAVCIDTDRDVLAACEKRLRALPGITAEYLHMDFLKWKAEKHRFDCIIMNPPFGAKKQDYVRMPVTKMPLDAGTQRNVPVELAFLLKAIDLLESGGRLLAVLPSSVILGQTSVWLRRYLRDCGRIRYVHELPQFTFTDLESRVYLLAFEKDGQSKVVTLLNHDLRRPSSIRVMRSMFNPELRLDFGFYASTAIIQKVRSRTPHLAWKKLGECATIFRGQGESPHDLKESLHTTDYNSHNWTFLKSSSAIERDPSERGLRCGDFLLKRVGRSCSRTLRPNRSLHNKQCSDCILIVRPSKASTAIRLLLATRVVMESSLGPLLIERGSGASYITESALQTLPIPLYIADLDLSLYRRYRYAVLRQNTQRIRAIEAEYREQVGLVPKSPASYTHK